MTEISIKIHTNIKGKVIALCDKEHLDKKYEEGKKVLNLKQYGSFYIGENKTIEETKIIIQKNKYNLKSVNAVGKKSIKLLKELGYNLNVQKIEEVEHAQIYKI